MAHQVTLEALELLPVLQTNDVIWLNGPLDRYGGFEFLGRRFRPVGLRQGAGARVVRVPGLGRVPRPASVLRLAR